MQGAVHALQLLHTVQGRPRTGVQGLREFHKGLCLSLSLSPFLYVYQVVGQGFDFLSIFLPASTEVRGGHGE